MSFFAKRMKDFKKEGKQKIIEPIELFKSLVQQEGYEYLRENQSEFLKRWHSRRDEKDIVGVLSTGAGKTLIGQLMLYSKMQEGVGPALYLCPDNQLVEQARSQASFYGIPVCVIEKPVNGERQNIPLDFINCESILVTTFEKLFNGKSIFGVDGYGDRNCQQIGALVIDDAHECLKKARHQSSIIINRMENEDAYKRLLKIFKEDLIQQGIGAYKNILRGEVSVIKQVPYWSWKEKIDPVFKIIDSLNKPEYSEVFYSYNLIVDELKNSQCFVSGNYIEITPLQIPVERIPAFYTAKHRYILSATLNNSYELITELGLSKSAVNNAIKMDDDGNLGERLLITAQRYHKDISDDFLRDFIKTYSYDYNVVVIVPSKYRAKVWEDKGAKLVNTSDLSPTIQQLKKHDKGNFIVLINRYDGLDLIGDMCRVLVIDGMPSKQSLKEKMLIQYRRNSNFIKAQNAQIIEQGLGRAVRSGTDHCVTFLMNSELLHFIGIKDNRKFFSPPVQAQLDFAVNLIGVNGPSSVEEAFDYMKEAIDTCLCSDNEWRKFHKSMVIESYDQFSQYQYNNLIGLSIKERLAISNLRNMDFENAEKYMQEILKDVQGTEDEGWYMQLFAEVLSKFSSGRAIDMQIKAHRIQPSLLKPLSGMSCKTTRNCGEQCAAIVNELRQYENGNDIVIAIDDILNGLVYSEIFPHNKFEESVQKLGEFLGFISTRPEEDTNDGPDNFWRTENKDVIIECKNNSRGNINRSEVEQMLHSFKWYEELYNGSNEKIGIMLHKSSRVASNAHHGNEFSVIEENKFERLKNNIREFSKELSVKSPDSWSVLEIQKLLNRYYLSESTIFLHYTSSLM